VLAPGASTVTAVIRAVFFDFGGVLSTSPFDAFASYEERSGLPRGFIRTVNATNPDDNAWAHLERGDVDLDEFAARFEQEAEALGHSVDGRAVLDCLSGELRPAMIEAVSRCGERFATGLLTNNFVSLDSVHTPHVDLLALFDVVVESSRAGVRKPEPRFYEIACELAGVTPEEVVFLDDLGINLKPAAAMGMTTIKVTDPDVALEELGRAVGFAVVDQG
jgi:putative hydrolase of the HAD superfamily